MNNKTNFQASLSKGILVFERFLLCMILCLPFTANAQVKINDEVPPTQGAMLDLKKTTDDGYVGGLLVPHVEIKDLRYIPATFTDAAKMSDYSETVLPGTSIPRGVDTNEALAGMIVYNSVEITNIPIGYYMWRGKDWQNLDDPNINGGGHLSDFDGSVSGYNINDFDGECGAYIDNGRWLRFMPHNLGADTSYDPFAPAAGLHGAKYRFGAKDPSVTMADDQNSANNLAISGWNTDFSTFYFQADGAWDEVNNNPCPDGWRLPTASEWRQVRNINNNTAKPIGTWASNGDDYTNYTAGYYFGKRLFLPAAGYRNYIGGRLYDRGFSCYSWSSSWLSNGTDSNAYTLILYERYGSNVSLTKRKEASPVRCVVGEVKK